MGAPCCAEGATEREECLDLLHNLLNALFVQYRITTVLKETTLLQGVHVPHSNYNKGWLKVNYHSDSHILWKQYAFYQNNKNTADESSAYTIVDDLFCFVD